MNKFLSSFVVVMFSVNAYAAEMGVPVQLRFAKPDGSFPTDNNASFVVQILSPSGGCIVYEEDFNAQSVVSGSISLSIGSGAGSPGTYNPSPAPTLKDAYNNSAVKNNLTCVDSNNNITGSGQSYNPGATDTRVLRVRATIDGTPLVADFIQRATPYALHAETVGGKAGADILVQNSGTSLNQSNLENIFANATKFNKLQNLANNGVVDNAMTATSAGTSNYFTAALLGDVTGSQSATVVAAIRGVGVAATAPLLGQVLGYDGSNYVPMTVTASAPVNSVNGQQGAVILNASHIAGVVTSASPLLGDVTGNVSATVVSTVGGKNAASITATVNDVYAATSLPTMNTIAKRDGSGGLTAATLYAGDLRVNQGVKLYNITNTNRVSITVPGAFADYDLVLPANNGNPGEVLQTDGSGTLTWAAGTSVTSSSIITALGFTPADDALVVIKSNNLSDLTSATLARTNLGLGGAATLNVGTTAGTVAAGDDSRIANALSQTAFNASVAPATCTSAQTMYWNSVSSQFACVNILISGDVAGTASAVTVTKVQGVGVSFASIATNHILQYNGANVVNRAIPTCMAGEYLTFNGTVWSCAADAGAGGSITSISVTSPISSTGGSTPTLSIAQANGSTNGYLSSADWTTFNNKITSSSASIAEVLGYVPASATSMSGFMVKTNNLSDVASATVARTNLGLGGAATLNIGTTAGTVAAGDDSRIAGALTSSAFNTYVGSAGCTSSQTMYWNSVSSQFLCTNILISGDVTGTASAVTVTRIQGVGASFTGLASNHILQYNGTNIINRAIPTCVGNQYLTFNGTAWSCATDLGSGGIVSSVTVAAPLQSTGGSAPTLSMTQATGSVSGYLSGTDWTSFNNKITSATAAISQVLGFAPANSATILVKSNNLSDLVNVVVARANLGLGGFATVSSLDLGSASATGTVAAARMPALTGDVTSTVGTVGTTVEKIRGVTVAATAPTTGQLLVFNGTSWIPTNDPVTTTRKTADQSIATTTLTNVTSMAFGVTAGVTYKFKFNVLFTSGATATGAKFTVTVPAGTISAQASIPTAIDGIDAVWMGSITSSGDTVTSTNTAATATTYFGEVEGVFVCTTTGTLQLQVGSETGTAITVKAGSSGEMRTLP